MAGLLTPVIMVDPVAQPRKIASETNGIIRLDTIPTNELIICVLFILQYSFYLRNIHIMHCFQRLFVLISGFCINTCNFDALKLNETFSSSS